MKKLSFVFIPVLFAAVLLSPYLLDAKKIGTSLKDATPALAEVEPVVAENPLATLLSLYDSLGLEAIGLERNTFEMAVTGYNKLDESGKISNKKLTIVDFSKPSTQKRLYIIDLDEKKLLFHALVAHGKNSGNVMANRFSNTNESLQSSLGFYVTAEKYFGKHGLSMRMDGMEKSNNNARKRAIVVHGADYATERFVKRNGYLGRSWGCPAVSPELNEPIINAIGGGSAFFIYSPQQDYVSQSSLISG